MENFTQPIIDWTAQHPNYISVAIFLVAFMESLALAGILVPGIVILFGLAGLAGGGANTLTVALLAAFAGAVAGDLLSFYIGRYFSNDLKNIWPLSRYRELTDRAEAFFQHHGGKSVIIGRFIGPIRPVLPAMAGALGMSARRFITFNIASALLWAPWYIVPGYLVGKAVQLDDMIPSNFYPTLIVIVVSILLLSALFAGVQWSLRPQGVVCETVQSGLSRYCTTHKSAGEYPLASVLLCTTACFGLLITTLMTLYWPRLKQLDHWVYSHLDPLHVPAADYVFVTLTLLGDPQLMYLLMTWFIVLLCAQKQYQHALISLACGLTTHLLTSVLKNIFAIMRPDNPFNPDSFAYPSGHSSGATLAIGLITFSITRNMCADQRWPVYFGAAIAVLLIATSRVYLEVHWLSDIIAGVLLGLAICGFGGAAFTSSKQQPRWQQPSLIALTGGGSAVIAVYLAINLGPALATAALGYSD